MPPLIFLAMIGAGAYGTFKLFEKLMQQAATPSPAEIDRIRREAAAHRAGKPTRDLGELELDEATGVYLPRQTPKV